MSEANKSIKQKNEELTKLLDWFNGVDFDIEQAIDKYKQAEALAIEIETDLKTMKNEIEIIKKRFDENL